MKEDPCDLCAHAEKRGLKARAEHCTRCGTEWHVIGRTGAPFTCMGECKGSDHD